MDDASLWTYEGRVATFRVPQPVSDDPDAPDVSWPHVTPAVEDLANAGFYFRPRDQSSDNCECFFCQVKLDEWAPDDDPFKEHIAHRGFCSWAKTVSKQGNPADPDMLAARIATFGSHWPHENKAGWKCKIDKMAAAGWAYFPGTDTLDAVRCWYCDTSIDDFEKQDDPYDEHHRRAPDCAFFRLSMQALQRPEKAKRARARSKRASKASRVSSQSVQSTFSEAPSFMSLGDVTDVHGLDQSNVTVDESTMTAAGKPKGRKAAAKRAPRAKKATAREASVEPSMIETVTHTMAPHSTLTRATPAAESSIIPGEVTFADANDVPTAADEPKVSKPRTTRAKSKPKAKAEAEPEPEPEPEVETIHAQSPSMHSAMEARADSPSPRRGVKRTSAGVEKYAEASQLDNDTGIRPKRTVRASEKPVAAPAPKTRTRKAKKVEDQTTIRDSVESKPAAKATRGKKAKTTVEASQLDVAETSRMYRQDTTMTSPAGDAVAETWPATTVRDATNFERSNGGDCEGTAYDRSSPNTSDAENRPPASLASPVKSDTRDKKGHPIKSPSKGESPGAEQTYTQTSTTTRVPLAASTPGRQARDGGRLTSQLPWVATDLELALLASPSKDGNVTFEERLIEAGGQLSSPEKKMTLEEWIRSRAEKAEERLKHECERMVATFEREGARALQVIAGIEVGSI